MKILLLGATGRTGKLILQQLVDKGYFVNALVRNKANIQLSSALLTVFEGDVANKQLLTEAMSGCQAIISALNISRNTDFPWSALRTPVNFLSASIRNIIAVANVLGIKRVIVLSAWGVGDSSKEIPGWFRWLIHNSNIGPAYKDHEKQERLLKDSNLDWTAIRPVGLTNFGLKHARVSIDNIPKPWLLISRRTVAAFVVNALEHQLFIRQTPVIFG
ncbi:NAD(P)-dependent oxidoreductase [Mucilaginibacter litoreus]|uniref:NAD(P)-dependent oxidoreductase n=1 Tax=Mucilaginibacter litoreus TaxID=1048221 RepID=A0ABW3ARM1_9SPHI